MEDKGEFVKKLGYLLYQMLVSTAAPRLWDQEIPWAPKVKYLEVTLNKKADREG
jgi:hypothetical protein